MYLQEKNGQHQKVWEILISSAQLGSENADVILNFLSDLKETEHKTNLQIVKIQHSIITTLTYPLIPPQVYRAFSVYLYVSFYLEEILVSHTASWNPDDQLHI